MARMLRLLVVMLPTAVLLATGAQLSTRHNPVKRVLMLLRMMEKKITEEGAAETKLFDKFMLYCATNKKELEEAVASGESKLPKLESSIKGSAALDENLKADIQQLRQDHQDAQNALTNGQNIRKTEAAAEQKATVENQANIKAIEGAMDALKKGAVKSFLQTEEANAIRRLTLNAHLRDSARDMLSVFLSSPPSIEEDAPEEGGGDVDGRTPSGTGEIMGILAEMKTNMQKDVRESLASEKHSGAEFEAMSKAKAAQIRVLGRQVEAKSQRSGEVAVALVERENEKDDIEQQLTEDKAMSAKLKTQCEQKKSQQDRADGTRSQERLAIMDAIKVLNDDSSRQLFRKTLSTSSPSFLQIQVSDQEVRRETLHVLQLARHRRGPGGDVRLDLIALALRAKHASFGKVLNMIGNMTVMLEQEQQGDDQKQDGCQSEKSRAEDSRKSLELDLSDLNKATEESKEQVKSLAEEIARMAKGIKDLDLMVADSAAQRQTENKAYIEDLASNNAANDLMVKAKARIAKFYDSQKPSGATFLAQMGDESDEDGEKKAESGTEEKASEGSPAVGVLKLMDQIVTTLTAQSTAMEAAEKSSQASYESVMKTATEKRTMDAKAITQKEGVKAETEAKLHHISHQASAVQRDSDSMDKYIKDLHSECDWFLAHFAARRMARTDEIESLNRARAILSGADYN